MRGVVLWRFADEEGSVAAVVVSVVVVVAAVEAECSASDIGCNAL